VSSIYDAARVRLLTGNFDWLSFDMLVVAWGGVPTFVPTDIQISELIARGNTKLGVSLPVTSQSVSSDGTAQTNQIVIPGVPIGQQVTHLTVCERATTEDQSQLILFVPDAVELPFDPNGLDMVVNPDWLEMRGWWRP
jgi:hypothetical protein